MFSVCVGVMGEVWFSFFSLSFHASVLYTCFFPYNYVCAMHVCGVHVGCIALRQMERKKDKCEGFCLLSGR